MHCNAAGPVGAFDKPVKPTTLSFSIIYLHTVNKLTNITYVPTAFTDVTVQSQYHGGSPNNNVLLNAVTPSV